MPNKFLKVILKPASERSIGELLNLIKWYKNCSAQEFKYAMGVEYRLYNLQNYGK